MAILTKIDRLMEATDQIEKQFRFQGLWVPPDCDYPRIRIRERWNPKVKRLAGILNRVFYIKALPDVCRLYGAPKEDDQMEFLYDNSTLDDRIEYVENKLNRLVDELHLLRQFDCTVIDLE